MRSLSTRILKSSSSSTSTSGQGKQPNAVSKVYSSRISTSTSDYSSIRITIMYDRFSSRKTKFVLRMSSIFFKILSLCLKDVVLLARLIMSDSLVPLRVGTLCPSPGCSSFDIFVLACKNSILNRLRFRNSFPWFFRLVASRAEASASGYIRGCEIYLWTSWKKQRLQRMRVEALSVWHMFSPSANTLRQMLVYTDLALYGDRVLYWEEGGR